MRATAALIMCIVAIATACHNSGNDSFAPPAPLLDRYELLSPDSVPEGVAFDPNERAFYATSLKGGSIVRIDRGAFHNDPRLPENSGRWHLLGDTGSAACTRTDRAPELAVDVAALGAAYLGGASLSSLAAGGRVTELVPGTLTRASVAFGWYRLPSPTEVF